MSIPTPYPYVLAKVIIKSHQNAKSTASLYALDYWNTRRFADLIFMSVGYREPAKVVIIKTHYVETDAVSFKSVVQKLTGKDSTV